MGGVFKQRDATVRKQMLSHRNCTDEILISDVNSDKSSLTIIYMCLKLYCLKYVVNLILFLFMWPRCGYLMFHPAPPPCLSCSF